MNSIWKIMVAGYYSYGVNGRRGLTLMFVSNPGESKTSQIRLFGKAAGARVEAMEGSRLEPQDILGLPQLRKSTFRFVPPVKLRRLSRAQEGGVFFADEFTRAPASVQSAMLNLMLDGTTEAVDLGHGVARWAACNPASQVGGIDLDPANASRFIWVAWPEMRPTDFQHYLTTANARTGEGLIPEDFDAARFEENLAKNWDRNVGLARTHVGSFISRHGASLREPPPVEARAWANPRTWDMATRALAAVETHFGAGDWDTKIDLVAGAVGRGHADEFVTWLRTMDLPDPSDILDGKAQYDITTDGRADRVYVILDSTLSVIATDIAGAVGDSRIQTRIGAWCKLLEAAAGKKGIRDIAAAAIARAMSVGTVFYRDPRFVNQVVQLKDYTKVIGGVSAGISRK